MKEGLLSCAWDSSATGLSTTGLRGLDTGALGVDIYLLKLEKKLAKSQHQVAFDAQIDTGSILKTVRSLL
jgi:hypothetical protein